jgi:predicted Fe-Mo cluster-binding NifX family protein
MAGGYYSYAACRIRDTKKDLLTSTGVFTERELESRVDVEYEKFTKKVQIEARVLGDLAINHIVPTGIKYMSSLLVEGGYQFIEPGEGELACHWYGKGRLAELNEVMEKIEDLFSTKDLKGERILITGGPTQEPIDPVRFITNHSTGKMGYALAKMARRRGAEVILVTGPTSLPIPRKDIEVVSVPTAEEMRKAVLTRVKGCSVVIKRLPFQITGQR